MLKTIILAAEEIKTMKSDTASVLHKVCGKAMIDYVFDAVKLAGSQEEVIVIGERREQIISHFGEITKFAIQEELLGTAHAVMQAEPFFREYDGDIIIISGNLPLLQSDTLKDAYNVFLENGSSGLVISAESKNDGIYIFKARDLFKAVFKVTNNNAQKKYYLTDVIEIMSKESKKILTYTIDNPDELLGVTNRIDLSNANRIMNAKNVYHAMLNGVSVIDPDNTYIDSLSTIEYDTVIHPNCYITNSTIGKGCIIGPDTSLDNMTVASDVKIKKSTCMDSIIKSSTTIGPYAYIRPNSEIGENVKIGDFVEVKKSVIDDGTKVSHLTYIGDSKVGKRVNFGCGTVTVNYDGENKFTTQIGDDTFIGCNTNLIAPINVGKDVYIAAGSTITDNIPDKNFAIARQRQINKEGWTKKAKK